MDTQKTNTLTLFILGEATAYHRWVFEKIKPYLGRDILEVGCGIGNLTGLLLSQGRVIAADINEDYLQIVGDKFQGHSNLKGVLFWDIQQRPTRKFNMAIDTIVCSNVLEHVEDDDSVLKNFYQLLPLGGKLVILVPALKGFYNLLDRELGHFRRYNKEELIQKLTGNGFRIRSLKFFNLFGILGWLINGKLMRKRFLSAKQIRIFNQMVPVFVLLEKVIPTLVGQSLIAVGEKD